MQGHCPWAYPSIFPEVSSLVSEMKFSLVLKAYTTSSNIEQCVLALMSIHTLYIIMDACSFDQPFEEIIYPKGEVDAVSIGKRDVDMLLPDTFVNDTIIDFYIKYVSLYLVSFFR